MCKCISVFYESCCLLIILLTVLIFLSSVFFSVVRLVIVCPLYVAIIGEHIISS